MLEVEHDADLGVGCSAPQCFRRPAMREQQMVRSGDRVHLARPARSVLSPRVADPRDDPRLVVRHPVRNAIAETVGDDLDVLDERLRRRASGPAARVFEHLRRVPVEQRRERRDAGGEQRIDEPVVEVEPRLVHATAAVGEDARPRDREAERVEPELAHQLDVVGVPVVEVARDRAGVAVANLAGCRAEAIPDALAAAVLGRCALDLVRGGRRAPDEAVRDGGHEPFPFRANTASGAGAFT